MESLSYRHATPRAAAGTKPSVIIGVVASGNLEVLAERVLPPTACEIDIKTSITGFGDVWQAVIGDFVAKTSPGGLRLSINDGGARPDTVLLRLAQAVKLIEAAP